MRRLALSRRLTPRSASLASSPTLIGAVTVVTTIVALYLAWNSNQRLPFVPTYTLSAQLPSASNLVQGNEVRSGGFRVGIVDTITTTQATLPGGKPQEVAIAHLKLDKVIEPLPVDSQLIVRPRSTLGLKYLQITPGTSARTYAPGQTIPLANATQPVELDDVLDISDQPTRQATQQSLSGLGDALAGRGEALNRSIQGLVPFFGHLTPVMQNLSAPQTGLAELNSQLDTTTRQLAPVSATQAALFASLDSSFQAIAHSPRALSDIPRKSVATEDVSIQSFRTDRPFLADATDLAGRLRPAARALSVSLPVIDAALVEGAPVLRQSVAFSQHMADLLQALNGLAKDPATLPALKNTTQTVTVGRPLVTAVAPYQTVCNYFNYLFYPLGEHMSEPTGNGTAERALSIQTNQMQVNDLAQSAAIRPVDVPWGQNPKTATEPNPISPQREALHAQPYDPAVDSQGNANCQVGQWGYLNLLISGPRYPPSSDPISGEGHVVMDPSDPWVSGPTFTGRPSLKSVP